MILSRASPRWAAQPHRMPWDSGPRPVPALLPHMRTWAHHTDDGMLTCDDPTVRDTLPGRRWAADPQKSQGLGTTRRWGVAWLGKTRVVPEAVIDKMQASPTPESVKERQGFVGIWGFGGLLSSPGTVPPSLRPPGRERAHAGLGQSSSHLWAGKNASEALASSGHLGSRTTIRVGRDCDCGRPGSGAVAETRKGRVPLGFWSPS